MLVNESIAPEVPATPEATPAAEATPAPEAPPAPAPEVASPQLPPEVASRIADLEAQLADSVFKIDAPVDQWPVGKYLDDLKSKGQGYYDAVGWEMISRHLPEVLPVFLEDPSGLPADLAPVVERAAMNILTQFTGLKEPEVIAALTQYKQGQQGFAAPTASQVPTPAAGNLQQLAYQYNLDPEQPQHRALLESMLATHNQLADVRGRLDSFSQAAEQRQIQEQLAKLNGTIDSSRNDMLAKVPVPAGYEAYKPRIENLARTAFENDPIVRTARANAEAYYKQGTPDLRAANAEIAKLQTRMSHHIKEASEAILNPIIELERLKAQVTTKQQAVKNFPPGSGNVNTPSPITNRPIPTDAKGWGEEAVLRAREKTLGKPNFNA